MDPRMLQQMMQQQQPQQDEDESSQGIPQVDPNFNPDQNPFEALINSLKGAQQQPQAPMQAPASEMGAAAQPQMEGQAHEMEEDQTEKGSNPDSTKPLVSAVQAMHSYIANSTDRDEIATARSIIMIISKLIEKDQANQTSRLG